MRPYQSTYREKLKLQHEIGQKEELLKERVEKFRYLVVKNYKVIYWINLTTVSSMQSMFNDTNLSIANNINESFYIAN